MAVKVKAADKSAKAAKVAPKKDKADTAVAEKPTAFVVCHVDKAKYAKFKKAIAAKGLTVSDSIRSHVEAVISKAKG